MSSDSNSSLVFECGNLTYFANDTTVTTLLEISEIVYTIASCSPLVISILLLAIIVIGAKRLLYPWQDFALAANRIFADIILALAMLIHFETRSVNDTISSGVVKHMFTIPGASWIEPKWLHFLFTVDFLMVLAVASFSCIMSAYALKQPTSYDEKMSTFFLLKISCVMWIVIGGISYLITIPDHHNTLAEKTLHHLTQPNPDGSLMQIALFCDQFDKEDVGIIEDTTVALAVPLICYLILGGSLFTLLAVLLRNRLKTRYYFGMFGAACRLGIQIGMYFIFLIVYLLAYFETSGARAVCTVSKNMCELLADIPVIKKYIYASIIATIVWLVRMLVDPVVDLVGDKRLRKALQRREAEFDDLVEMLEHNQDETEFGMN